MEYVHSVLLLHKFGKEINEENIRKVIEAAGGTVDEAKIKTLIASLKGVDIEKELEAAIVAAPVTEAAKVEKPAEEKKEEAAEGLSSLFS